MGLGDLQEFAREQEDKIYSLKDIRKHTSTKAHEIRESSEIDYARVLYSSSFRRLQGKIQLFIPYSHRFNRNRLTHSLEVAQISGVIARHLKLRDTLTVQACALAHDIGHPPFGHAGEKILNQLSSKHRFEGNAQTFRILSHLEEKHYEYNGLNLSYRTLLGTVKYFQTYKMNKKKFLYDEDYSFIREEILDKYAPKLKLKTIDAQIMDIADEIAYAAHDLEDALSFKLFSIDELLFEFQSSPEIKIEYSTALAILTSLVEDAKQFASNADTYHSSEEYTILFKKKLTSLIVDKLVNNLKIDNDVISYEVGYDKVASGLKKFTYNASARSSEVKLYELNGEKIIRKLYEVYTDKKFNQDMRLLPAEYRDEGDWERCVIDYISGMMDNYAISKYKEFFGNSESIYTEYTQATSTGYKFLNTNTFARF